MTHHAIQRRLIRLIIVGSFFMSTYDSVLVAQNILFKSEVFSVTSDKVIQGKYQAVAKSPRLIESNYQSDYRVQTPRQIQIKFSINGFDNEAPAGQNHLLILNSQGGSCTSPLFVFGEFRENHELGNTSGRPTFLNSDTKVTIRINIRPILRQLKERGYFETSTGQRISAGDFKGIYVAGNTPPLTWNFQDLTNDPQFALSDSNGTGIYETTILFKKELFPGRTNTNISTWELKKDVSAYPAFRSSSVLSEALYNQALEEMVEDIRPDGAFMAGAMWPGVWTRDVSYSALLSLAIVEPDAVKRSLLAKVSNDRIIQDTGTGGSWPVSSDRMVWALAAWEVYKVTGDKEWLAKAYEIIRNSAQDDLHTLVDAKTGMFHGESSFLDWREQTYPRWMDPKDIYQSENLGTNAVQYETYRILAAMASDLGLSPSLYLETADHIKKGINKYLWIASKGYYGQYLYGRNFLSLSQRAESLGEALCVIFGVTDNSRNEEIVERVPVTDFGITCIYPQIPGVPPYHNDAVWPFVESYWAWASASAHNVRSATRAISSVYRAAAFFLTNKENMVASTGDFMGTQINSSRQLWSVAGNLAIVYRVIFGMEFFADSLRLAPCIPTALAGTKVLTNFTYRKSKLTISIEGTGDRIDEMTIDGVRVAGSSIPCNLQGSHVVLVKVSNRDGRHRAINLVKDSISPEMPSVSVQATTLKWAPVNGAVSYDVFKNGEEVTSVKDEDYIIPDVNTYSEYQIMAVGRGGTTSFLSEPAIPASKITQINVQAEDGHASASHIYPGFTGKGYIALSESDTDSLVYYVDFPVSGEYSVDFRYANGNGPINTDNKCAIRTMEFDGKNSGAVVMPQRGDGDWQNWGCSNSIHLRVTAGNHKIALYFDKRDNNMNGKVNSALLDSFRLIFISQ